jgi:hypothetical protein
MATELNRIVKRRTGAFVFDRGHREIIASLEPVSKTVGVRLAGTRDVYRIDFESIYSIAVKRHSAAVEKRAKEIHKNEGLRMASARAKARKLLSADLKPFVAINGAHD